MTDSITLTTYQKSNLEKIIISTPDSVSGIVIGGRWEAVVRLLPASNVIIVTDTNISGIYGKRFPRFPVLKIRPGEDSKRLKTIESLAGKLLNSGIDRSGFLLGIGGGVVCDITGFLASVFMRGIRFGYVSTSLLSQVDASTGGKNGVNLGETKNVIGTFRQPEFVICDTTMLRTLPDDEYSSGLGELIKTGIIGDRSIIEILEDNYADVLKRNRDILSVLVAKAVRYKASVVAKDEKESGLRRVLNFGHTFGHAVELHDGVKHGFAVASGMMLAATFSRNKGLLRDDDFNRIMHLLKRYNFPTEINMDPAKIESLILHDKKKAGSDINFVFIKGFEKPLIKKIPLQEVIDFYRQNLKGN
ncbi:MAG: 3-dehydroquinate synthase [Bacteroidetes bacterium ADurb.Bin145]|nr:MAG: 3-dehydroquinate synthase [Bacteroidetes bacterium ADurb.Bin145]